MYIECWSESFPLNKSCDHEGCFLRIGNIYPSVPVCFVVHVNLAELWNSFFMNGVCRLHWHKCGDLKVILVLLGVLKVLLFPLRVE
jgi:hypothetical protein